MKGLTIVGTSDEGNIRQSRLEWLAEVMRRPLVRAQLAFARCK